MGHDWLKDDEKTWRCNCGASFDSHEARAAHKCAIRSLNGVEIAVGARVLTSVGAGRSGSAFRFGTVSELCEGYAKVQLDKADEWRARGATVPRPGSEVWVVG